MLGRAADHAGHGPPCRPGLWGAVTRRALLGRHRLTMSLFIGTLAFERGGATTLEVRLAC